MSVEAPGVGVLDRLAGLDVVPVDPLQGRPAQHGAAGEFCSIVADDDQRPPAFADEPIELTDDALAG